MGRSTTERRRAGTADGSDADAAVAPAADDAPAYGETWVYERIVGAVPGVSLDGRAAVGLQVTVFAVGTLVVAAAYDLWGALLPGGAALFVAAVGSALMLRFSARTRRLELPATYRRFLFASGIEVVLGVLAFVALVTHLFVFDATTGTTLLGELFGGDPPVVAVYLMLLLLWDLCYRIGTSWWAAVVGLWRSYRYRFDAATAAELRRADATNVVFGLVQTLLLPFLLDQPVLFAAVAGHVVAVTLVSTLALATVRTE